MRTLLIGIFVLLVSGIPGNTLSMPDILLLSLPANIHAAVWEQETQEEDALSWWRPAPGVSWQWQLSGALDTSLDVEMYDVDLNDTSTDVIAQLKNNGKTVICYLSAGSWENYRDDADQFPEEILGNELEGWPDERWLDIRRLDILGPIMSKRLDLAVEKGCDGIEPDNVDGYTQDTGFQLSGEDQLTYNRWLAEAAHARGLSIGLKNDLEQVQELVESFDWAINEQCFQYDECELLLPFIQAGKAVFGVEYSLATTAFCSQANSMNFDWLKKNLSLDGWRESCR